MLMLSPEIKMALADRPEDFRILHAQILNYPAPVYIGFYVGAKIGNVASVLIDRASNGESLFRNK